ncbi:MAG: PhoH family protein [Bacteroidetes bacterium]|nr:MAG: PhoH family protein [Bacteroidota bacterium]
MTEHTFLLENISPLEVYGVNNLRLQQIAEGFPEVKFVARGDELKVKGEAEKIEKLKSVLAALFEEIRRKGRVSENRFLELVVSPTPEGGKNLPMASDEEVLVHGSGGLMVRPRNRGQQQIVGAAHKNDVVFAVGPAGTGKTYIAVALAVKALKEKQVKRIILCRPAVDAGESLGFLPGDMKEKVDPYLRPLYDALGDMIHTEKLKYYLDNNVIEIVPLAYMRGRTLDKAFVIMDEAQNATEMQLKMFLTRLGEHSRMIVTGDDSQIDLPARQRSGLLQTQRILQGIQGIAFVRLTATDVVRHRLVRHILAAYEQEEQHAQVRSRRE